MTTKSNQLTTEPRHWTNETADAAVQAAIEARALAWATAQALGLPDDQVERAPQEAERLRLALDDQSRQLIEITRRDARTCTHLAQAQARVRALEADRAAIIEALLSTDVETASDDPVQLAAQVAELCRRDRLERKQALADALQEILDEARGDFDRDVILTAARDALKEEM